MTTTHEAVAPASLEDVFYGLPRGLLRRQDFEAMSRLALRMDVLGRLDADTGVPLVEPQTLRTILQDAVGGRAAVRLVDLLDRIPGSAFVRHVHPPATEVSWFDLAARVAIYDPEPGAAFGELELTAASTLEEIVTSVQARFPSMEPELIVPTDFPRRLRELVEDERAAATVLHEVVRQLGWWAALATVLLVPAAQGGPPRPDEGPAEERLREHLWPLSIYLLCSAVGGWTLTVAGSWVLAPRR